MHGAVLIVLERGFDERKAVDVANVCLATASKHVEPTDVLFEFLTNATRHFLLCCVKIDRIAELFTSVLVSLDFTVNRRASAGFGVCVVWSHCIDLDIEAIRWQKLLVQVATIRANSAFVPRGEELGAGRLSLAE